MMDDFDLLCRYYRPHKLENLQASGDNKDQTQTIRYNFAIALLSANRFSNDRVYCRLLWCEKLLCTAVCEMRISIGAGRFAFYLLFGLNFNIRNEKI